jgi:hypothetical protein
VSNELEQRLRRALAELPGSTREVEARAREAALVALPRAARRNHRRRLLVLALASAALLVAGAAALAAIGTIQVRLGASHPRARPAPAPARLTLPHGSDGFALVAGGRLYFVTRGGVRIEGLRVSAAAISPRALYVAVGIGSSLVVMAPDGRHAWMIRTGGRVAAVAWAPSGLEIAYVVAHRGRPAELRLIEGDGDHDQLVDAFVSTVTPSWRGDSLGLAYVGVGGHAIVYDLGHRSWQVVRSPARCGAGRPVRAVAFAPASAKLAFVGPTSVVLSHGLRSSCVRFEDKVPWTGLVWISRSDFVTSERGFRQGLVESFLRRFRVTRAGQLRNLTLGSARPMILSLAVAPSGSKLAVAAATRSITRSLEVLVAEPPASRDESTTGRIAPVRFGRVLVKIKGEIENPVLAWR